MEYALTLTPRGATKAEQLEEPLIDFASVASNRESELQGPALRGKPTVIGQAVAEGWWDAFPKAVPPVVRVAAARAHACEQLRQIQEDLESVIPEATGIERRMIEFLVRSPLTAIIDMLNSPELVADWEAEGPRLSGLIKLLVLASGIASGVAGWADVISYIQKAIDVLRAA